MDSAETKNRSEVTGLMPNSEQLKTTVLFICLFWVGCTTSYELDITTDLPGEALSLHGECDSPPPIQNQNSFSSEADPEQSRALHYVNNIRIDLGFESDRIELRLA